MDDQVHPFEILISTLSTIEIDQEISSPPNKTPTYLGFAD